MKDLFVTKKNKCNSGFSLVELVVAIGILAVISTIVAFMMTSSSKNYSRMSVETQLQSEAQLVANAISEYAIDSYNAENLCAETLDSSYDNTENKILVLHSLARDGVEYDYGWNPYSLSYTEYYIKDETTGLTFMTKASNIKKYNIGNDTYKFVSTISGVSYKDNFIYLKGRLSKSPKTAYVA